MKRKKYTKKLRAMITKLYTEKNFPKMLLNGCYKATRCVRAYGTTYDELYERAMKLYNTYFK